MENDEISLGMLSVGKYEILYASSYDEESESKMVVQYLNGASVKFHDIDLQHKVEWRIAGKSIDAVNFLLPRDEAKLGDVFDRSPYGLIKKNRTGIGATTLELKSPRNSIIVVPTKSLAYNKAKNTRIGDTNNYKVLYVGGSITGFNPPLIRTYLEDENITDKKFIVVADSLPKLLREIGEENYRDYFFMVDEIDSYQYDSHYRPKLEDVIDYYFLFPPKQRCLVSATVGDFSNEKVEEEPVICVKFQDTPPRTINLIHTNHVVEEVKDRINEILREHPDDKILIAYNSLSRGIIPVIKSLEVADQQNCAVLCSQQSETYVRDYYAEIVNDILPKKITFMTCTYFVGIDISERFHLISASSTNPPHSLLSEDKFQQIAGRCRHDAGLLSETIIYNTKDDSLDDFNLDDIRRKINREINYLTTYLNVTKPTLESLFPKIMKLYGRVSIEEIVENSSKTYCGATAKLLRIDINGHIQIAYFSIDYLLIQIDLLNALYTSVEALKDTLKQSGHRVIFNNSIEHPSSCISPELQESINADNVEAERDELSRIVEELRAERNMDSRKMFANRRKMTCTKKGTLFLERFIELQQYVPFEQLVLSLSECTTPGEYKRFYNSVIFWSLSKDHPFKKLIEEKFPIGSQLSSREIHERLTPIFNHFIPGYSRLTSTKATRLLGMFCKKSDADERIRDRRRGNLYTIISYDVNNFNTCPFPPISADEPIHGLLKLN